MKKILIIPFIAIMAMSACIPGLKKTDSSSVIPEPPKVDDSATSTRAIGFEQHEYALSKKPDIALQEGFQKILDIAYKKTVESNSEEDPKEIGFIYSMRPTGAINPFSEVEVTCIIQERHKQRGQEFCGTFFSVLGEEYRYLLHPEERPKEDPEASPEEKK